MRALACLLLSAALVSLGSAAAAQPRTPERLCSTGAREPVRDPRIRQAVALARQQHALFGGQWIDRRGSVAAVGYHEAESDRPPGESLPTWKRVAAFWQAVDPELPSALRGPDGATVGLARLRERLAAGPAGQPAATLEDSQRQTVESALLRTALVDQPWSAVFISYLMKSSGFSAAEFGFSDTHADYVEQAVLATTAEANSESPTAVYRACDIARTRPRAGDMVCHTREGSAAVRTFGSLRERLAARRAQARGNGLPMHCDLVTRADQGGDAKMEVIGGNVVQSVTLRQLALNADKVLSRTHFQGADAAPCARAPCRENLNRKPWVVLLQFRH